MDRLVTLLTALRREGRQQSGLDPALVPVDANAAYAVAARVAAALEWPVGGWKIAANSREMQQRLRAEEPIFGRVFSPFLLRSGVTLPHGELLHPIVECEYAVRLGEDLPPRDEPYTEDEVADAVAAIHPAIEVAECRFVHDAAFPPLTAVLADGSGSGSLVLGPAIADWRWRDLEGEPVVLRVDGVERRQGNAGAAVEHPIIPLTWLANRLSRVGMGLNAADVVSTGTCTGMVLARAGETHEADFGAFGRVSVRFG